MYGGGEGRVCVEMVGQGLHRDKKKCQTDFTSIVQIRQQFVTIQNQTL